MILNAAFEEFLIRFFLKCIHLERVFIIIFFITLCIMIVLTLQ